MFRDAYQSGLLSIFYSLGSNPLNNWQQKVINGHIKRVTDEDIQSFVLEIIGTNVSTTYISCPTLPNKTLSIRLPILVIVLKNLKKYFSFEVQILDDQNIRRRFKASTFQTATSVKPFACMMPIKLDEGWNQVQFDLSDFTKRAYNTNFVECLQIEIHANCRLRRVYFCDRIYSEEELPKDYKLYLPIRMLPTPRN
ncbi:hypothetical protein EG68_09975 [Paragonimus skrjabini miyazakii]|uniref:CFA20 domain-containing protein n=1 Tax=Paragonimus skrjabini miyazakii TaxID=59628 RepID=A0A8S9YJE5_9TREM|nr:hypothetical protein EG68_09975 [Paragonimus skrjabini miyazakii]